MSSETGEIGTPPVALVIGGAGAIGAAIAAALERLELAVVIAGRNEPRRDETQADSLEFLSLDVAQPERVSAAFQALMQRHGRLDLLVNAAGGANRMSPLLRMSVDRWDEQYAMHSRGAFLAAQHAGKIMRKQRSGRIINVASIAAESPVRAGYSAYAAAKSAMVGLTKCLNQELNQYGVQSTAICPSYVDTPVWQQTDVDRSQFLQPEDVAATVAYLWQLPSRVRIDVLSLETTLTASAQAERGSNS